MAVTGRLADIAQKSAVILLAGTTGKDYYSLERCHPYLSSYYYY